LSFLELGNIDSQLVIARFMRAIHISDKKVGLPGQAGQ
jgi:hypothetical protein